MGLPARTASWMARTTAAMRNHIKTAYGISQDSFLREHGPGQGNRMGPALWLIVSSFAFEQLEQDAHGVDFCDPTFSIFHHRVADAYVDDVTGFFNLFYESIRDNNISVSSLSQGMERDAELWNKHLHISGGALEYQKCFWYLMYQTWNKRNRQSLASKEFLVQNGAEIEVSVAGTDQKEKIELKDCSECHKTLGTWKQIDGSNKGQIEKLRLKSKEFGEKITNANLSMIESRMAAEMMLVKSLDFPLASSSLTREECESVHRAGLTPCIRKAGFAATTNRAIIHGPRDLGGAAFTSLYSAQFTGQMALLQHHLREGAETADLIRINLSWHQLVADVGFPILDTCAKDIPYMDNSWIMSIQNGLVSCRGSFRIHDQRFFPKLRDEDEHIMDRALSFDFRRPGDLRDVNYCRLFCGVITLADAATADGRRLAREVYTCSGRKFSNSTLLWPRLPKPSDHQKKIWRTFLAQLFLKKMPSAIQTKGRATPNRVDLQLSRPLGRWLFPPTTRQRFRILYCNDIRFEWDGSHYIHEHTKEKTEPEDLPSPIYGWERYDGRRKSDKRWPSINKQKVDWKSLGWKVVPTPVCTNLLQSHRRESWMADYIHNTQLLCDDLETTLNLSKLITCGSDGGAKDGKGSFGWVMQSNTSGPRIIAGMGGVDGLDPSSYRGECSGILSVLCAWDCLFQDSMITPEHQLHIYCDNRGAVAITEKLFGWKNFHIGRDASEADLLYCIRNLARKHHGKLSISWVASHQDDKAPLSDLPFEAVLNIEADRLATRALQQTIRLPKIRLKNPAGCDLMIDGTSITWRRNRSLKSNIDREALKQAILKRTGWTPALFESIFWPALGNALTSFPNSHQVTIVKHSNDILPIGKTLLRREIAENSACESCSCCNLETFEHMLACDGHSKWRKLAYSRMMKSLYSIGTGRHVTNLLVHMLMGQSTSVPRYLSECMNDCDTVGRVEIWRGRLPRRLVRWQHGFLTRQTSTQEIGKEGSVWAKKAVKIILTEFLQLWWFRNDLRHNGEEEKNKERRREMALHRCRLLSKRIRRLGKDDQQLFANDSVVCSWNTGTIRAYLNWAEPLADECADSRVRRERSDWDMTDGEVIDPP